MKIFIPCAGIGSRLEYLTKNLNKSLVTIQNKPAISHLIEKFSNQHTFVIALGFKGDLLKQFLTLAYPDRKFEFIEITKYEGEGSGLGYTISSCKDALQEPFLFIPTDSLFEEDESYLINHPDCVFFSETLDEEFQYRKVEVNSGKLQKLAHKMSRGLVYTGICHIHSFQEFWKHLDYSPDFIISGESYILNKMAVDLPIKCQKITWHDIGNLKALEVVKKKTNSSYNILDKENEAIWFIEDTVIKYHEDPEFIANRVKRYQTLTNFIPELLGYSQNMYKYRFVQGKTLSENFDLQTMLELLDFLKTFWGSELKTNFEQFKLQCSHFYKNKTLKRLNLYKNLSRNDCEVVNGINIGPIESLINRVDWNSLSCGFPSNFHGDLHFENILKTDNGFCLLDWRQDFEGNLEIGDRYYDFAKLLHGMIVAHDVIKKNLYSITYLNSNSVYFDVCLKNINLSAQQILFDHLAENNFDVEKVKILTALIFLNIAPLHHEPYNHMLYYLGKLQLHTILTE